MKHPEERTKMMFEHQNQLHNFQSPEQNGNAGPLVHKLLRISNSYSRALNQTALLNAGPHAVAKARGAPVTPDLLGTINASLLLEQEVPGAEELYETGNDTGEFSRGQITCYAKHPGLCP